MPSWTPAVAESAGESPQPESSGSPQQLEFDGRPTRPDTQRPRPAAWIDTAWTGTARIGTARIGTARPHAARITTTRAGVARTPTIRSSTPRIATARIGVALLLATVLASCAAGPGRPGDSPDAGSGTSTALTSSAATASTDSADTTTAATASTGSAAIPTADAEAIRRTIDTINATAGGPVADQRAVLDRLAQPDETDQQRDCPTAHTTLRLDPVYGDLRRPPDDRPTGSPTSPSGSTSSPSTAAGASGLPPATDREPSSPAGSGAATPYLLPVLITIFTGDRITGTDLATLRLFVIDGTARTQHLCVS